MKFNSKNCNILMNAANRRHKKDENEVYDSVMKQLNIILKDKTVEEQIKNVKALIAFFDGRLSRTHYYTVTSIAYAMLATGISILVSVACSIHNRTFPFVVSFSVLAVTLVLAIIALQEPDFNKAFVRAVLNDKMQELQSQAQEHCSIESEPDVCDEETDLQEKVHTYIVEVCKDRS